MVREHDAQLLEAVAVRRSRMRESLLWGKERRVRVTGENLKWLRVGAVLATVACAACVGWSFLEASVMQQRSQVPAVSR